MIDLKELRAVTEDITSGKALFRYANAEKLKTNFTMATKPSVILELLNRLEAAEKVCEMLYQNIGMHCAAVGKCIECKTESTPMLGMCCKKCIDKALMQWQEVNKCADQQQKK